MHDGPERLKKKADSHTVLLLIGHSIELEQQHFEQKTRNEELQIHYGSQFDNSRL